MVNLLGLLVIALFAYSGYRRGLVRMAASLLALLVAGLLAQPLAPLGALPLVLERATPRLRDGREQALAPPFARTTARL